MNYDKFFLDNPDWLPYADLVVHPPEAKEILEWFEDCGQELLDRCLEMTRDGGGQVSRGALYVRIRREESRSKCGDKWATMLALQSPPGLQTNDTFWAGRKSWVDCFGEEYANRIKAGLARKGVHLKAGDEYMPELVRPDMGFGPKNPDPQAVVPFGGGRSYIKKLCETRGWACEGAVNVNHRQPEKDPLATENCKPMGLDLVAKKASAMVKKDPSMRKLSKRQLTEIVRDKHGAK